MSESNVRELSLNVTIDEQKSKVLFAEANGNVVGVLRSFLTLPLGRIVRILEKHYGVEAPVIGSLSSLCRSSLFNDVEDEWRWPKLESSDAKPLSFVICDDLRVVPVESGFIQTLNSVGITHTDGAEFKRFTLGIDQVMDLLKFAVTSPTPLTDLVFKNNITDQMSSTVEEPQHEHEPEPEPEPEMALQEIEGGVEKMSLKVVEPVTVEASRPNRNKKLPGKFKEFKMG